MLICDRCGSAGKVERVYKDGVLTMVSGAGRGRDCDQTDLCGRCRDEYQKMVETFFKPLAQEVMVPYSRAVNVVIKALDEMTGHKCNNNEANRIADMFR